MKRIIIILLAAILAVSCGKSDREIRYTADAKIELIEAEGFGTKIESHEFENGEGVIIFDNPVTAIPDNAFYGCKALTSITIPYSVTSIGYRAFRNCRNLASITIPNNVTSIEEDAFRNCKSLTSITIPDSVTSIGSEAFAGCRSLTSITIPDSVTSIGKDVFKGCYSLNAFYGKFTSADNRCLIVDGVLILYAKGCDLTQYTIPDGVTSIGRYAFSNCKSLTSVTIPNSVTKIESYAFDECQSLKSVYCKPTTPPTGGWQMLPLDCNITIYVPEESVEAYEEADWRPYAHCILGYSF